jgi:hypothetical protein
MDRLAQVVLRIDVLGRLTEDAAAPGRKHEETLDLLARPT